MRLLGGLAWAAGLALLIGLIVYQGVGEVLSMVSAVWIDFEFAS